MMKNSEASSPVQRGGMVSLRVMMALLLFVSVFQPKVLADNASIKIEGYLVETRLDSEGRAVGAAKWPFAITYSANGNWSIAYITYNRESSIQSTDVTTFDGENVFNVFYSDKRYDLSGKLVTNLPLESGQHPATMERGPLPINQGPVVGCLWLAFIGGEFVQKNPNYAVPNMLIPDKRGDPETWLVKMVPEIVKDSHGFLKNADFILSTNNIGNELINYPELNEPGRFGAFQDFQLRIQQIKNARADEVLRAQYSLTGATNLNAELSVPATFKAVRYSMIGDRPPPKPVLTYEGFVTNAVSSGVTEEFSRPAIKGLISVQDYRFKERTENRFRNSIFYELDSTGWVLSTNDPRFNINSDLMRLQPRQHFVPGHSSWPVRIFLIVAILCMPIWFLVRILKQTKRKVN